MAWGPFSHGARASGPRETAVLDQGPNCLLLQKFCLRLQRKGGSRPPRVAKGKHTWLPGALEKVARGEKSKHPTPSISGFGSRLGWFGAKASNGLSELSESPAQVQKNWSHVFSMGSHKQELIRKIRLLSERAAKPNPRTSKGHVPCGEIVGESGAGNFF